MSPIIFQPPLLIESSLLQSYKGTFFIGLNNKMSVLSPSSREAMKAVATLLAQSRTAWPILNWPSGIQPKMTAAMEARKPTTVAWTCGMNSITFTHQTFLSLKIPLQTQKVNVCSLIMPHSHYHCPKWNTSRREHFTLSNFGLFPGKKTTTLFIHLIISKPLCIVYSEMICKQGSPFLKGLVPELVRGFPWSFSTSPWLCPSVQY